MFKTPTRCSGVFQVVVIVVVVVVFVVIVVVVVIVDVVVALVFFPLKMEFSIKIKKLLLLSSSH